MRSAGMGRISVVGPDRAWGIFGNPANLSPDRTILSVQGMRNFGLADLTDKSVVLSLPLSAVAAAGGFTYYGNELFKRSNARLGLGGSRGRISGGLVLHYTHISIRNYGSAGALGLEAGLLVRPMEKFVFGTTATNINRPLLGDADEELPRLLKFGFLYRIADHMSFATELTKDVRFPVSWRGGLEMRLADPLQLRVGVGTQPLIYTFGIGIRQQRWSLDLAAERHHYLGFSYGVGISWKFGFLSESLTGEQT